MIRRGSGVHNTPLAVFASGTGRSLEYLLEACGNGGIPGRVRLLVTDRADIRAIEVAREAGIRTEVLAWREAGGAPGFSRRAFAVVEEEGCALVLLAGFTRLLVIPELWRGRVLNIHPALLPQFGGPGMYGRRVHEAVLASGAGESGCSVHYADEQYDHGPVILQGRVPVLADDTPESLSARVFEAERETYPRAVRVVLEGLKDPTPRRG